MDINSDPATIRDFANFIVNTGQGELDDSRVRMKRHREKYKMVSRKIMHLKGFTRKNYQGGERFIYDQFARSYLQTALEKERGNARNLMLTIEMEKYHFNRLRTLVDQGAFFQRNSEELFGG